MALRLQTLYNLSYISVTLSIFDGSLLQHKKSYNNKINSKLLEYIQLNTPPSNLRNL